MKPIILFLSAMTVALMCVLAYYAAPMQAASLLACATLLVAALVFAYVPAHRHRARIALLAVLGIGMLAVMFGGRFNLTVTVIAGAIAAATAAFYARDRVKMRDSGIPYLPGDEHKTDEELASNSDIKLNLPWWKNFF